jgi:hypothetical protein
MPILNSIAQVVAKPFPRVISPRAHGIINYINVGFLMMSGGWFWRRNKRAAVGAFVGGGAALVLNLLTSYPGGVKHAISFRGRREIDLGLAAMMSTLPEFFAFDDDEEKKLFTAEGVFIATITELTRFPPARGKENTRSKAA